MFLCTLQPFHQPFGLPTSEVIEASIRSRHGGAQCESACSSASTPGVDLGAAPRAVPEPESLPSTHLQVKADRPANPGRAALPRAGGLAGAAMKKEIAMRMPGRLLFVLGVVGSLTAGCGD